jgi:dienelactone hydrolase
MRVLVFIFMLLNMPIALAETLKVEIEERKFGKSEILVEIVLPSNDYDKKLPLIITQHGSTLDAEIDGSTVRTDEHSKRLLEKAIKEGFAVAVVDAFYTHDIKPNQKHSQPYAADYAKGLAAMLSEDSRFDPNNFFFSGFSYGGHHAHFLFENLNFTREHSWAAIVAAEPPCNAFFKAKRYGTPVLTLKGGESHYKPRPCEILTELYQKEGTDAKLIVYPKSNHYFSHNGKITEGIAFNGCNENPIIMQDDGVWAFLNGEKANREIAVKRCMTKTGGSGKSREDLDLAIDATIEFFKEKINY